MLLMYFRFACSRDIFRCNQLLSGTGPFWKYSGSLSKELDLLLILNTLEKNCENFHDLYYSSYHDLNNIQNLSVYCKSLYRTIVLGKKPTYVHSQIQCKQAKLWKTSTALTYDRHLGMHWFLFTKILFAKKMKNDCYLTVKQWDNIFVMKFLQKGSNFR